MPNLNKYRQCKSGSRLARFSFRSIYATLTGHLSPIEPLYIRYPIVARAREKRYLAYKLNPHYKLKQGLVHILLGPHYELEAWQGNAHFKIT